MAWERVVEITAVLQSNPGGKQRKKLLRELASLAEEQRLLALSPDASETEDASLIFLVGDPEDFEGEDVVWIDDPVTEAENAIKPEGEADASDEAERSLPIAEFRSIIHPVEGETRVMPDVATDISDFFTVPEASKDDIIWRAPLSGHRSGATGKGTEAFVEDSPEEKEVLESNKQPVDDVVSDLTVRLSEKFGVDVSALAEMEIEPAVAEALLSEDDRVLEKESADKEAKDVLSKEPSEPIEKVASDTLTDQEDDSKKEPVAKKKNYRKQDLAQFKQIYTSRDGSLNVYQDSFGHIISVDASKLV